MRNLQLSLIGLAFLGACSMGRDVSSIRLQLERTDLSAIPVSVALVELPTISAIALLSEAGRNGTVTTLGSSDRRTISVQHGVLVRTAGFGNDLFYADPIPTLKAIKAGDQTSYQRTYSFLTEADRIVHQSVACTMRFYGAETANVIGKAKTLSRFVESCSDEDAQFQNEYWLDESGSIQKSKERVSPALGYATIELSLR